MTQVQIRDYERNYVVARVEDGVVNSRDDMFDELYEELTDEDGGIPTIYPGEEAGEYRETVVKPGERGYERVLVDELPSPLDIDDRSRLAELPIPDYEGEEAAQEPESEVERSSRGIDQMAEEMAQEAISRLSKGRRYIDDPSEAPEGVEVQEGPQGGLYYDTGGPSSTTELPISPEHLEVGAIINNPLDEGPDRVNVLSVTEDEVVFGDGEGNVVGRVTDEDAESEEGEGAEEEETDEPKVLPTSIDDVYDQLQEDYSIDTVREVSTAIEDWDGYGYTSPETAPIWAAAIEEMGGTVPDDLRPEYEEFESHGTIAGREVENPNQVVNAVKDIIEMSRERLREIHGDEMTLYRGYRQSTYDEYTETTDRGHLRVQPAAMESWTRTEEFAAENYDIVAEREVPVEKALFDGDIVLDMHDEFDEVTLGGGEEYEIHRDNWTRNAGGGSGGSIMDDIRDDFKTKELKTLPAESLDWLRDLRETEEKDGMTSGTSGTGSATYGGARDNTEPDPEEEEEDVKKARRYIDDPSEAPEDVEVHEGQRGGLYYETESEPDAQEVPEGVEVQGEVTEEAMRDAQEYGFISPGDTIEWVSSRGSTSTGTVQSISIDEVGNFRVDVELPDGGKTSFVPSFGAELTSVNGESYGEGGAEPDEDGAEESEEESEEGGDDTYVPPIKGFDHLTEDYQKNLEEVVTEMASNGHLDYVDRIKYNDEMEANGVFRYEVARRGGTLRGEIMIRNTTDVWGEMGFMHEEGLEMMEAHGERSTSHPFHTVIHEIAHGSHQGGIDAGKYREMDGWRLDPEEKELAREHVSDYAATNPMEFVAETFVMKVADKEVPDEIQEIYERFEGPEP